MFFIQLCYMYILKIVHLLTAEQTVRKHKCKVLDQKHNICIQIPTI